MRRRQAGFTLIEITVALVAGLVVAIGIVGLSKEATRTFHEEVRNAAAEATVRTGIDRLTADLSRAGYMSTANIQLDLMTPNDPGTKYYTTILTTLPGLRNLASIRYSDPADPTNASPAPGKSLPNTPLSLQQPTTLAPDCIDIGGNFSSSEQFEVMRIISPAGTAQVGVAPAGGCQQILLSYTSSAIYRIAQGDPKTSTTGDLALRNVFQPTPAANGSQFIVRIIDDTLRAQFVATCATAQAAGIINGQPYLWIDSTKTPLMMQGVPNRVGGLNGSGSGAFLNAVQVVRYEITRPGVTNDAEPAQYGAALGNAAAGGAPAADPAKYDLMRSFVDVFGKIVPETSEVVAEYAVDFKVAFSVDTGLTPGGSIISAYALDDTGSNSPYATSLTTANQGPQRIRSVRARLTTRTAVADRKVNIPLAPANYGNQEFMYRYCIAANGCTGTTALQWARARTVTTEVSLPNQMRDFW